MLPHVLDQSFETIEQSLVDSGEPVFRVRQIRDWIFKHGVIDAQHMKNIGTRTKRVLEERFDSSLPALVDRIDAKDQTSKLLLKSRSGKIMEAVLMRYEDRTSLCVSSQVGCKLACAFCQTGKLGFFSHLNTSDIMGQFLVAQGIAQSEGRTLRHIVFMGMGEPFDNYEASVRAANLLITPFPSGFGISSYQVTVSTSGVAPKIIAFGGESRAALAVSLHAADNELRSKIMPINRKYPLDVLKDALLQYQALSGREITIEYLLLDGVNSNRNHAKDLVRYLDRLKAKVNLIPFNDYPGSSFKSPSAETIRSFQLYLSERGIPAPVRYSRGLEVYGACGQLAARQRDDFEKLRVRKDFAKDFILPS